MNAVCLFEEKWAVSTADQKVLTIFMDLYKVSPPHDASFPEGYRFSWIAFEVEQPENRVLFDCHPPKGPHLHVDLNSDDIPFQWKSLDDAMGYFFSKVRARFGEIPELKGVFE